MGAYPCTRLFLNSLCRTRHPRPLSPHLPLKPITHAPEAQNYTHNHRRGCRGHRGYRTYQRQNRFQTVAHHGCRRVAGGTRLGRLGLQHPYRAAARGAADVPQGRHGTRPEDPRPGTSARQDRGRGLPALHRRHRRRACRGHQPGPVAGKGPRHHHCRRRMGPGHARHRHRLLSPQHGPRRHQRR